MLSMACFAIFGQAKYRFLLTRGMDYIEGWNLISKLKSTDAVYLINQITGYTSIDILFCRRSALDA